MSQQARANHDKMRSRAKPTSSYRRVLRRRVYERDGYVCWLCGEKVRLDVSPHANTAASLDHVIPVSKGGKWSMENLRTAHRSCNDARGVG